MKLYLWVLVDSESFDMIVLWDGKNTYWSEEMIGSCGYKKMRTKLHKLTRSKFIYIGEL